MKHIYKFLLIIPILFSNLNIHSPLMVEAVQSPYENIGTYCKVEEVTSTQLICFTDNTCYRYASTIDYIEETGRIVYSTSDPSILDETIILFAPGVLNPPVFPFNGDSVNFNFEPSTYYYYIADTDSPKITSIKYLKNNLESLIEVLNFMEYQAIQCGINSQTSRNRTIVSAIRAMNTEYCNIFYFGICGWPNSNYVQYINNDYSRHLRSVDYFSYFLKNNLFNSDINAGGLYTIDPNYCTSTQHFLFDPFSGNNIDLIHMFAVIDGNMPNTISNQVDTSSELFEYTISFIGDIQTGLVQVENKNRAQIELQISPLDPFYIDCYNLSSFEYFCEKFDASNMPDIVADMDGYTIANGLICENYTIAESIDIYYSVTVSRKLAFRSIVIDRHFGSTGNHLYSQEEFNDCILYYFGLEFDTNLNSYCYNNCYGSFNLFHNIDFYYLYRNHSYAQTNLVTVDFLIQVFNLFSNYIFEV